MNAPASCVAVVVATLTLAAGAVPASAAPSNQCPYKAPTSPHPDAQRAGHIIGQWSDQIPPGVGDQYSSLGVDNARGAWFVGYSPGPQDEAAIRARVLEIVDRNASPEDAAFLRDHLLLDPQRYSEKELRDVQDRLVEQSAGGRFGTGWSLGASCMHGDVRRAELTIDPEYSTPEQQDEARRAAAQFGDRALVAVKPGTAAHANAGPAPANAGPAPAVAPVCPLITPVPPPAEGTRGFVFVGQHCRAGDRVEDYAVVTDFGDGTRAATPFRADGLWLAGGDHAYRRAGRYTVVSTITHRPTGGAVTVKQVVNIKNAALRRRTVARPRFVAGRSGRRVVAAFTDGNRLASAADHRATVRWGDGTRSAGRVRRVGEGRFEVVARHRYTAGKALPRRVVVKIADDRGARLNVRTALARAR